MAKTNPAPGAVIWFTGLSGSGKSTISEEVFRKLKAANYPVELLDGDVVRDAKPGIGFSREDRDRHILNMGERARTLEASGKIVIASFISPYRATRDQVRSLCKKFVEVYVSTPIDECERRDVKGLYARARRGEIANFTGIDDPYEPPFRAELELDTRKLSVAKSSDLVIEHVRKLVGGRSG